MNWRDLEINMSEVATVPNILKKALGNLKVMHSNIMVTSNLYCEGITVNNLPSRTI